MKEGLINFEIDTHLDVIRRTILTVQNAKTNNSAPKPELIASLEYIKSFFSKKANLILYEEKFKESRKLIKMGIESGWIKAGDDWKDLSRG